MSPWKKSATLISLVRNTLNRPTQCNYEILFQKRSSKSAFYPNAVVFPGGASEASDFSEDWLKYFKSFGISQDNFNQFQHPNAPVPPILKENGNVIKNHIALRITAIRETFEELGVLICRKKDMPSDANSFYASYITGLDILSWQKKVHDDPMQFLKLCESLECYPDIFSLYLWNNWLTPARPNSKRYDSLFFLTAFENKPEVFIQEKEVSEFNWSTPKEVIEQFDSRKLLLAPPQWYELNRMSHREDFHSLMNFAKARSAMGSELFFPMYQKMIDGHIVLLPGDEYYPSAPDFVTDVQVIPNAKDMTIDEVNASSNTMHRMIRRKQNYDSINLVLKNYTPSCFHLNPDDNVITKIKNKL